MAVTGGNAFKSFSSLSSIALGKGISLRMSLVEIKVMTISQRTKEKKAAVKRRRFSILKVQQSLCL